MWKILIAFLAFAAVGLFVLKKAGGNVDLGGEKHVIEAPAAAASAPASAASQ